MAVRIDASGDGLSRTANIPTITSFTMMAWVYWVSFNTVGCAFAFGASSGSNYYELYTTNTGLLRTYNGGSDTSTGVTLSSATWMHLAITVAGTGGSQFLIYKDGALASTQAGNTIPTAAKMWIGNDNDTEWASARFAGIKIYSAVLAAAEIANEMQTILPQRYANLNGWYPTFPGATERLLDYSGSGNNWTAGGTLTDEDPPPVAWGGPVWLVGKPTGGGAQTVNAAAGALTLAGQQAAVQPGAVSVAVAAGTLSLSGQSSSVQAVTSIAASAGALALAGQSATVAPGAASVAADIGALALTGQQATVTPGAISVDAAAGALALAGQSASVDSVTGVAAAAGALTLAGQSGSVVPGAVSVAATAGSLSMAGQQATVSAGGPTIAVAAGALTLAGLDVTVEGGKDPVGRGIVWIGTFESQNEDELESDLDSGPAENSGTFTLSYTTTQAHSGTYSAKLLINTASAASGIRLFRKKEIWENLEPYYYSAWFYFPSLPTVGTFFNIFQFKTNLGGASEVAWKLEANNFDVGAGPQLGLRLVWDAPIDGPFEGDDDTNQGLSFYQGTLGVDSIPIPLAQWVHIEGYLEQSENYDGRIMFWQDGVQIFDVHDIRTKDPGGNNNWSVNNYGDDITPNPWTIYIDDMVVSTERSYPIWSMPTDTQQPDATAGIDTQIRSSSATTNFGTTTTIRVGEVAGSAITDRGLFKPDLSGIPAGATIHSAMLSLMVTGKGDASNNRYIQVYRLKRAWVEAQATWNIYSTGNNWGAAGGFDTTDCEQTAAGQIWLFQDMQVNRRVNIMLDCRLVQEWVDGTFTNNGVLLKSSSELNDAFTFGSSDNATAGNRPYWQIAYSVAASDETIDANPGALSLAGQSATVQAVTSIAASAGTLALAGQQATVTAGDVSIAASSGALTLAGQSATVTPGAISVDAAVGALALSGQSATVELGAVTVAANAGDLALAGAQATVVPGAISLDMAAGELTLAGQQASAVSGAFVSADAGALALAGQQATVTPGAVSVGADTGALTLAGQQATVTPGGVTVDAQPGALAVSGQSAGVDVSAGSVVIDVAAGLLSLSGQACEIQPGAVIVVAAIAALALIGRQASISEGATRGDWDVSDAPKYQWEVTDAARYVWTLTDSSR